MGARTRAAWAGLRHGHGVQREPIPVELWRAAVSHTRARVLAEALALFLIGFTLDDLRVLRVPGFLAGSAAAVLVFAFGGLLHGRSLARRVAGREPPQTATELARYRARGRALAAVVVVVFVVWLSIFSQGVPPWAA